MISVGEPWPIIDVSAWEVAGLENQGQQPHDWLRPPDRGQRTWLFKPARARRHRSLGEDAVEKLASEVAAVLTVPAASVELAVRNGERGTLVKDARPAQWELQAGRVLLPEVVPDYDPDDPHARGYNVETICRALHRFAAPPDVALPESFRAFDTFAGYLVFDALIAHGDRHDRNWAVLVPPPGSARPDALCASFDHAASLGFTVDADARAKHLRAGTVMRWACRGRAARFEHQRKAKWQSLVDVAGDAVRRCPEETRSYWRDKVMSVEAGWIKDLTGSIPDVSSVDVEFTAALMMSNRERLLHVIG